MLVLPRIDLLPGKRKRVLNRGPEAGGVVYHRLGNVGTRRGAKQRAGDGHQMLKRGGLLGAPFVLAFIALWWMVAAELWLAAETVVLLVTGIVVIVALARRQAKVSGVTLTRLRFGLVIVDLKGKP